MNGNMNYNMIRKYPINNWKAAGILFFEIIKGEVYFILHKGYTHLKSDGLSDFGGGREEHEDWFTTAAREWAKETGGKCLPLKSYANQNIDKIKHNTIIMKSYLKFYDKYMYIHHSKYVLFVIPFVGLIPLGGKNIDKDINNIIMKVRLDKLQNIDLHPRISNMSYMALHFYLKRYEKIDI